MRGPQVAEEHSEDSSEIQEGMLQLMGSQGLDMTASEQQQMTVLVNRKCHDRDISELCKFYCW